MTLEKRIGRLSRTPSSLVDGFDYKDIRGMISGGGRGEDRRRF
jgi:hypothetical protein